MKKRMTSLFMVMTILCAFLPVITASAAGIEIGDYLQMGTYYGEPILWRCVDIDENGPLMLSDRIICLKPFDAAGDNTSGSHGRGLTSYSYNVKGYFRQESGSNYWADSNIRCWLNSNESAGNVTWLCGNPPDETHVRYEYNDYANEAGFKTNFTPSELGAIKTITQDSLIDREEYSNMSLYGSEYHKYNSFISSVVQNAKTTAYRERIADDFFLMDVNQVNSVYNNSSVLGDNYYIGEPTEATVKNSEYTSSYLSNSKKYYYWLRSPYVNSHNSGCYVRLVFSGGDVGYGAASDSDYGVRPAFYLNTAVDFVSGAGTDESPYRVSVAPMPVLEFSTVSNSTVVVKASNVTGAADAHIYLAVYDEDKKLKRVYKRDFADEVIFADVDLDRYMIKAVLWDGNQKPLATPCEEYIN